MSLARKAWDHLPRPFRVRVKRTIRRAPHRLPVLNPVSDMYGIDRGTPIDRVYIDGFLVAHKDDIAGRVLEVREDRYASSIGGSAVTSVEVVDIETGNPRATLIADLAKAHSLPESAFDCFILTQTLQYVEEPLVALANARRCLKPDGVLLMSVPCISRLDPAVPQKDRWRFNPAGVETLLSKVFNADHIEVTQFGSLASTLGYLIGLAAEELPSDQLHYEDPYFPLVVCARARKSEGSASASSPDAGWSPIARR